MTAPVVQQPAARPGSYLVQFVMPSGFTAQTLPVPEDVRVRTRRSRSSWRQRCGSPAGGRVRGSRNAGRRSAGPSSPQASARPVRCVMPASTRPGRPGSSAGTRPSNPSRSDCEVAAEVLRQGQEDTANADVPLQAAKWRGLARPDTSVTSPHGGSGEAGPTPSPDSGPAASWPPSPGEWCPWERNGSGETPPGAVRRGDWEARQCL